MNTSEIIISDEFKNLIPPLSESELQGLHDSLDAERGATDKLVVWDQTGILLDGHHRYAYCTKRGFNYEVRRVPFENAESAKRWMIWHQLSRRNLSPEASALLRGKLYNSNKQAQGGDRKSDVVKSSGKNCHLKEKTEETIAKQTGVSPKTVRNDAKFAEAVEDLGIEADVMSGKETRSRKQIIQEAKVKKCGIELPTREEKPTQEKEASDESQEDAHPSRKSNAMRIAWKAQFELSAIGPRMADNIEALDEVIKYCKKRIKEFKK